ncbi:MAG: RimK family protein [Sedimentisphaerales bacterium]|nr:RimK family protein [Sedimentisphaerales bacterium]
MKVLLVVSNPKKWPLRIPNVEVISARKYVIEPIFSRLNGVRVFNLMHQCRYQSLGYYVSLLAEARGHKPVPNITTLRDLQTPVMVRTTSVALQELIENSLRAIKSDQFTLSIYFGKNMAKKYDRLCRELFNRFHAHFLRADFSRNKGRWSLQNINTISINEVPTSHHNFVEKVAKDYFARGAYRTRKRVALPYSMAILYRPDEANAPSNPSAVKKFIHAGQKLGIDVELITKEDFGRLSEFDALFIRETTSVNNHTFRFARYAEAEGLVVIDDPQSIIRCANKVFLAEMLAHQHVKTPRTVIVHKDNIDLVVHELGFPCVLKQPDSSFSVGVKKVTTHEELQTHADRMLDKSELIIAQEYLPTEFDWRVGVLDNKPLYVCRYYMAKDHWQIIRRDRLGRKHEGRADTLTVEAAPPEVIKIALKATGAVGHGFYGVDIKQIGNRCYVIEVNDNPNIDAGVEDEFLKNDLYLQIMRVFLRRMEAHKNIS